MNTKRLAIIPARKGSKRIVNKNVRMFSGKPMIHHIIKTAITSNLFNKIHVSTNCTEIAAITSDLLGYPDFLRSDSLAQDDTPLLPVLQEVQKTFQNLGEYYSEIWLLMACAPLITSDDLNAVASKFSLLQKQKPNSPIKLLSVAKYPAPIEWAYEIIKDGRLNPYNPEKMSELSQTFPERYYDTGTFCIYTSDALKLDRLRDPEALSFPYILPKYKAIDIDTPEQWEEALQIYKLLSFSKNPN